VIDRASQKLNNAFPDDPEIEADLRTSLSRAYKNVSHWDQAQRELNIALELNTRTRGKTSDQTLAVRKELALIYHIIDDRGAKLNNARAIEAAMNERYGASDLKTLDAQGDVVDALEDYGYHSEARKGSEELWSELKKRLGVDSASTLTEQIRYSWLLLESGRIEEAKEICGDAFERIKRQVHTENNILIKRAKCCLGAAYIIQGHIDSAETLYGMRKMPEQVGIEHVFQGEFDLDGEPFQLIVFFETWCPYSRRAMLRIRQVDRQYSQFGLKILGFTNSSPNDDVENYLEEQKISFAAFKENGRSWNYFGCEGTPAIRLLYRGYLIWEYYWPATDRIPTQMLEAMVSAQSCGIIQ
jgi:tetratricopeptide (TPR) repeat protein